MIQLVSLNPSLDLHFTLDPDAPGKVGRILEQDVRPGGKALNVARFLKGMRIPSRTWIAVAGGDHPTHRLYRDLLRHFDPGLRTVLFPSRVPVRFNLHVERGRSFEKNNHPGTTPTTRELDAFLRAILRDTRPGDLVVLTGRLPGGTPDRLYHDWILALQGEGRATVIDTSGDGLRYALAARPFFVKVNLFEMSQALSVKVPDLRAMKKYIPSLLRRGLVRGAVTDGPRGALVWEGERHVRVRPRECVRGGVVGAGDAFLAGWLAATLAGVSLERKARFAADCGSRVARRGIFDFGDVHPPRATRRP